MSVVLSVNGNSVSPGFLVAPDDSRTFTVPLELATDDGTTVDVTIDVMPNGAGLTVPGGPVSVGPTGVTVPIAAASASAAEGDTSINVHAGAATVTFTLTAISNPEIWFSGRFEVRFATDNDWYNDPKGTWGAGNDGTNPLGFGSEGFGYTFWLEGEPLFTPTTVTAGVPDSVPTTPDKTGVGRVVRFNNPVAPRSHADPVVTSVNGVRGQLSSAATVYFTSGDPVIGSPVNLGPNTYLAQNWEPHSPPDPPPAESQAGGATDEPMACFEFQIDGLFSAAPAQDSDRPKSTGFTNWADDPNSPIPTIGALPDFPTFTTTRQTQLQNDYDALPAADEPTVNPDGSIVGGSGSAEGRNLVRRLQALAAFTGTAPPFAIGARPASLPLAWAGQEEYENGHVNANITFTTASSTVMDFYKGYSSFAYYNKLHTFHSDELCGYVYGNLQVDTTSRLAKTCSLQTQNSTFGRDELQSIGLPASFPSAFWVVLDGFFPSELGIDSADDLTNPPNPPTVAFSVDPTDANAAQISNYLITQNQMVIEPFAPPVLTMSVPPANAPQRILYPFTIQFTGTDGFIDQTETLTLTATITVSGKTYTNSAPLELTTAANPYVTDADQGNNYTTWISTDLRTFSVDDDTTFFGHRVADFYPPGAVTSSYPVSPAAASSAATAYVAEVISQLTAGNGDAGGDSFETSLTEQEDATVGGVSDALEYLQVNPRTNRAAFNFAICRVRIRGTTPPTPPPPFTTQAPNCRVFFRAFQAQNTASTFDPSTTYRSTPIVTPDVTPRVPLLGVMTDSMGQDEVVTIPFFAVDRVNLAGPADLTTQRPDAPNVQTISPITGSEVDTYFGCWLDMNEQVPLFPQYVEASDPDNRSGTFDTTPGSPQQVQSINAAFTRAPHQCLIAEIAFDDVPIPLNADSSTSDKLAQRNLAYVDGPNPGSVDSRMMPHPFQVRATSSSSLHVDELMVTWGGVPEGATATFYFPSVAAADIVALADGLYPAHTLSIQDPYTIATPTGAVTFVPLPKGQGYLAGLLTVQLPAGIQHGDRFAVLVRQLTDASAVGHGSFVINPTGRDLTTGGIVTRLALSEKRGKHLTWRRVLGAFQIDLRISSKRTLLVPEEHRLALFRWISDNTLPESRWSPVLRRYVSQLAERVGGFGGHPGQIPPSPLGALPGQPGHGGHPGVTPPRHRGVSGKVHGLSFDHFGDFDGFVLETEGGELVRFNSREHRLLQLVRDAMEDRLWVTVVREHVDRADVRELIIAP
jgi:hypothetical protein